MNMKSYLLIGGEHDGATWQSPENPPPPHVEFAIRPRTTFPLTASNIREAPGGSIPTEVYNRMELVGIRDKWFLYAGIGISIDEALFRLINGYVGKRTKESEA